MRIKMLPDGLVFVILFLGSTFVANAQKLPIDSAAIANWPRVAKPAISGDGKYATYVIENKPVGSSTLVVTDTDGNWKQEFPGGNSFVFSADSKRGIFRRADTLYLLELGTQRFDCIANVASFKYPYVGRSNWVGYCLKSRELILKDVVSGRAQTFENVTDYNFCDNGVAAIVKTATALSMVDLASGRTIVIWRSYNGSTTSAYKFDESGKQLVFIAGGDGVKAIYYYREGMDSAVVRVDAATEGIGDSLSIVGGPQFSKNGKWIFFELVRSADIARGANSPVPVKIWSYKDLILEPQRLLPSAKKSIMSVVGANGGRVVQVEGVNGRMLMGADQVTGDYVVARSNIGRALAFWWPDPTVFSGDYLVSLKDGSRRLLGRSDAGLGNFLFSPSGKYLVYYDENKRGYIGVDLDKNSSCYFTKKIAVRLNNENINTIAGLKGAVGVGGWVGGSENLIIYDNYDIWLTDPSGRGTPVNITNGYGAAHGIKFRLVYGDRPFFRQRNYFKMNEPLLIVAFDVRTKYNGFYTKILGAKGDPVELTMGPYTYFHVATQLSTLNSHEFAREMVPLKADDEGGYIFQRESATEAPNYYFTTDFKKVVAISGLSPQRDFNWLTTELMTWKQLDGSFSQGVLYKPQNFDPHRKYPIIFNYYEQLSHRVFEFPVPEFSEGNINIPWFVSRGYLVFTPDIHYRPANVSNKVVGEWAYNSVVSAAVYLSHLPYVDAKRMGVQGHSFGGLETAYLVTHTHLFAAAMEAAGQTDLISAYLTPTGEFEDVSTQEAIETGHSMYGANPWQRPDLYRRNSAVLNADQVTVPLLIMQNPKDNQIQWRQGVELYMALRRLGKKVWMLEYVNSGHTVWGKDAVDYTRRLTQFFNYYLKGEAPPVWMTADSEADMGQRLGFALDHSGRIP